MFVWKRKQRSQILVSLLSVSKYRETCLYRTLITNHDIVEILLKLTLNTNQSINIYIRHRCKYNLSIQITCLLPPRGFAPGFVNYKKGCTRLAAASDKVYQLLAHGRLFSSGTPASSTTKTGHHDIAEILLKVELKHLKSINQSFIATKNVGNPTSVLFRHVSLYNVLNYFHTIYAMI